MRQFIIDELSPMERDNIDSYLKRNLKHGPMMGLYWFVLTSEMLSEKQCDHEKKCGPYYLGVEVEKDKVRFEMLVRSNANLHCDCIAHATTQQRHILLEFIDKMLEEEMIRA